MLLVSNPKIQKMEDSTGQLSCALKRVNNMKTNKEKKSKTIVDYKRLTRYKKCSA